MNPYQVVADFERRVADYAGAPYGVAVDSCTNALFLCLRLYMYYYGKQDITIPCRTYVGVAHAVKNAGHILHFADAAWQGIYPLAPTTIIDSAKRFHKGMYHKHGMFCLSFHEGKILPIGDGGMILLDKEHDYNLLKRMRFDGRQEGVKPKDDTFNIQGWHCTMKPPEAARGLQLMQYVKDYNEDLPMDDYADLSKHPYFTE